MTSDISYPVRSYRGDDECPSAFFVDDWHALSTHAIPRMVQMIKDGTASPGVKETVFFISEIVKDSGMPSDLDSLSESVAKCDMPRILVREDAVESYIKEHIKQTILPEIAYLPEWVQITPNLDFLLKNARWYMIGEKRYLQAPPGFSVN